MIQDFVKEKKNLPFLGTSKEVGEEYGSK